MAKITKTGINPIVIPVDMERGLETEGRFAIHELVRNEYRKRRYADVPLTPQKNQSSNGMQVSVADMAENPLTVWLAQTRYFFCKAMREVYKNKKNFSPEELRKISPKMAHASIKSLVEEDGRLYIPCHIRGKGSHGTGQLLSVLAAGGVDPPHLRLPNPIVAALQDEIKEEIGIDDINLLNPNYTFDLYEEEEVGRVNFSMYARGIDLNFIVSSAAEKNKETVQCGKRVEVSGMALIPFDKPSLRMICDKYQVGGVALLPFDKSGMTDVLNQESFSKIPCYVFDLENPGRIVETSYKEYSEGRKQKDFLRPFTQATLATMVNSPKFMNYYREQSGR